jgi:hypothetical protein
MNSPCITRVTNAETGEIWTQETGQVGPARLGVMRKLTPQEVAALNRKHPKFGINMK